MEKILSVVLTCSFTCVLNDSLKKIKQRATMIIIASNENIVTMLINLYLFSNCISIDYLIGVLFATSILSECIGRFFVM